MKLVLESPLSAPDRKGFLRNVRYAAWCARVLTLNGHTVWASHLYAPHFLDDRDSGERILGMGLTAAFTDDTWEHWHFVDLGISSGMKWSAGHFVAREHRHFTLGNPLLAPNDRAPTDGRRLDRGDSWNAFLRGEWPPCTPGFEIGGAL